MSAVDRLDQIEARAQAATDGPWTVDGPWHHEWTPAREDTDQSPMVSARADRTAVVLAPPLRNSAGRAARDADIAFITHARTDVPALVAAVRAVLDKHQPLDAIHTVTGKSLQVCSGCGRGRDWMPWPCPTVQAVEDALGGERA